MTLKWLFTLSTFPLEKQRHILIDWGMIRLEILEARHRNTYISWMSFGSKEIKLLPYNTHHGSPTLPRENYGSLELKTQRVSNGWTLGSLNLRRDSRGSQEQWLLFCLFTPRGGGYESCRTGNDVVSRYIFAPVCRPARTTLQYSLFKCRPQSFQLEEVRCYSFTTSMIVEIFSKDQT